MDLLDFTLAETFPKKNNNLNLTRYQQHNCNNHNDDNDASRDKEISTAFGTIATYHKKQKLSIHNYHHHSRQNSRHLKSEVDLYDLASLMCLEDPFETNDMTQFMTQVINSSHDGLRKSFLDILSLKIVYGTSQTIWNILVNLSRFEEFYASNPYHNPSAPSSSCPLLISVITLDNKKVIEKIINVVFKVEADRLPSLENFFDTIINHFIKLSADLSHHHRQTVISIQKFFDHLHEPFLLDFKCFDSSNEKQNFKENSKYYLIIQTLWQRMLMLNENHNIKNDAVVKDIFVDIAFKLSQTLDDDSQVDLTQIIKKMFTSNSDECIALKSRKEILSLLSKGLSLKSGSDGLSLLVDFYKRLKESTDLAMFIMIMQSTFELVHSPVTSEFKDMSLMLFDAWKQSIQNNEEKDVQVFLLLLLLQSKDHPSYLIEILSPSMNYDDPLKGLAKRDLEFLAHIMGASLIDWPIQFLQTLYTITTNQREIFSIFINTMKALLDTTQKCQQKQPHDKDQTLTVSNILEHYRIHHQILPHFSQFILFNTQWYQNYFLGDLLNVSEAQKDPYPEVRQKLIQLLRKNNKIPSTLYMKYEIEKDTIPQNAPVDQKFDYLLEGLISTLSSQSEIEESQIEFCLKTWEKILKEKDIYLTLVQDSGKKIQLKSKNKHYHGIVADILHETQNCLKLLNSFISKDVSSFSNSSSHKKVLYVLKTHHHLSLVFVLVIEEKILQFFHNQENNKSSWDIFSAILFTLRNVPVVVSEKTFSSIPHSVSFFHRYTNEILQRPDFVSELVQCYRDNRLDLPMRLKSIWSYQIFVEPTLIAKSKTISDSNASSMLIKLPVSCLIELTIFCFQKNKGQENKHHNMDNIISTIESVLFCRAKDHSSIFMAILKNVLLGPGLLSLNGLERLVTLLCRVSETKFVDSLSNIMKKKPVPCTVATKLIIVYFKTTSSNLLKEGEEMKMFLSFIENYCLLEVDLEFSRICFLVFSRYNEFIPSVSCLNSIGLAYSVYHQLGNGYLNELVCLLKSVLMNEPISEISINWSSILSNSDHLKVFSESIIIWILFKFQNPISTAISARGNGVLGENGRINITKIIHFIAGRLSEQKEIISQLIRHGIIELERIRVQQYSVDSNLFFSDGVTIQTPQNVLFYTVKTLVFMYPGVYLTQLNQPLSSVDVVLLSLTMTQHSNPSTMYKHLRNHLQFASIFESVLKKYARYLFKTIYDSSMVFMYDPLDFLPVWSLPSITSFIQKSIENVILVDENGHEQPSSLLFDGKSMPPEFSIFAQVDSDFYYQISKLYRI